MSAVMHPQRNTSDTSSLALAQMGLMGLKTSADDVYVVISIAVRSGVADLSGKEIQSLYERRFERRIDSGTVSARLSNLIAAKRVVRSAIKRECSVSKKMVYPVSLQAAQTRLVW